MNYGSNALANWLWKDLYVWPQGRLTPSTYLGGLFRIVIVYVLFAQVLSVLSPTLFRSFNSSEPMDIFDGVKWGQIGAIVLIAFPVWSLFQRRVNDMRPDIRAKLTRWTVAFPINPAKISGKATVHRVRFARISGRMSLTRR